MGPAFPDQVGGVVKFDMAGDPRPALWRRQALLGSLLSTLLDLDLPLLAVVWALGLSP